jgi:hypothetical protein
VGFVIAILGIGLALTGVVHWYLWRRLVRDTTRPGPARRIGAVVVIVLAVLLVVALVGFRALPVAAERVPAWAGFTWLALMFYSCWRCRGCSPGGRSRSWTRTGGCC